MNQLPQLNKWDKERLENSIKDIGIQLPIVFDQNGRIIDGHHRIEIAERLGKNYPKQIIKIASEEDFERLSIDLNLARRNLSFEQINQWQKERKKIALEARKDGATQKEAAEEAGVGRSTIALWESETISNVSSDNTDTTHKPPDNRVKLDPNLHEEIWQRRQNGETTIKLAEDYGVSQPSISSICANVTKRKNKEIALQKAKDEAEIAIWEGEWETNHLYQADVTSPEFLATLSEESIDFIFTDPPYATDALITYKALAMIAAKTLKPGRVCAVYCGKLHIPEIILYFTSCGLEYYWTFAVYQPRSHQLFRKRDIYDCWRPIIVFNKPGIVRPSKNSADAFEGERDKSSHEWQQSIEPAIELINKYSVEGEIVLEPYCGGGTTPVACIRTNRKYLAFDNNPQAISASLQRIGNEIL